MAYTRIRFWNAAGENIKVGGRYIHEYQTPEEAWDAANSLAKSAQMKGATEMDMNNIFYEIINDEEEKKMHDIGDLGEDLFYTTEEEKREYEEEKRRRACRDYERAYGKRESEPYCREGLKIALKSVIIDLAINPDKMIEEEEFHELATLLQNTETALYAHTHFSWKDETEPF